jgi:hypothetical protein
MSLCHNFLHNSVPYHFLKLLSSHSYLYLPPSFLPHKISHTLICPPYASNMCLGMKRVKPTRCYTMVYWNLRFAQHVSGIIMPIIRSLRLYRWPQRVAPHLGYGRLLVWCMAAGLSVRVEGCYTRLLVWCMAGGLSVRVEGCCTTCRATSLYPDA